MRKNILVVFAAFLLLAVAVYSYEGDLESSNSRWNMFGHLLSLEGMDEIHDSMTESLDSEQTDPLHEGCTNSYGLSSMSGMMGWRG
ncbi:hypothetical protein HQ545_00885 [Candidatus Woesearchaeota archaeon]|nr:hypothetical protein [Candidatus Woesearchaeota archaeon]